VVAIKCFSFTEEGSFHWKKKMIKEMTMLQILALSIETAVTTKIEVIVQLQGLSF
jgi:hypothetical protein